MNKISKQQRERNALNQRTKNELYKEQKSRCAICKRQFPRMDLVHILPKSIHFKYYTEKWNLVLGCRECHRTYDLTTSADQRRVYVELYNRVVVHAEMEANRHFRMNG